VRGLLSKRPSGINHSPYNEIIVKGACRMLDLRDTLSLPAGGVGARAGAVATGRALFITLLAFINLLSFSQPNSYAWKNHSMNLKLYAHNQIKDWTEFECYVELIHRESSWNYRAKNGSHFGLGQMRSTWYRDLSPRKQIKAHLDYLDHRYKGSACKALRHLIRKGWH
jgi:hypothetical protein